MNPIMTLRIDALAARTTPLFAEYPLIKAVYLFGSLADGTDDARSDLDFGVLCEPGADCVEYGRVLCELGGRLVSVLRTDRVDVVVLNLPDNIPLRFAVVQDGVRIFTKPCQDEADLEAYLEEFERRVRQEFFDYKTLRQRLREGASQSN